MGIERDVSRALEHYEIIGYISYSAGEKVLTLKNWMISAKLVDKHSLDGIKNCTRRERHRKQITRTPRHCAVITTLRET